MPRISALRQYLKQHPHYIGTFLKEICRVWWWHLLRRPIVVLTTESGGLGDYLWFRCYYSAIRDHYSPTQCRIIVIGMRQWEPLAFGIDTNPKTNHFDIYRSFETPDNPLKIEALFFKLFRADVFVDFRARHLQHLVRAKECYYGKGFREAKQYYETVNNETIIRWFSLPEDFHHTPPLLPISDNERAKALEKPFVIVVEGGNTQGKLSAEQTLIIVKHILAKGYDIFFNGNCQHLLDNLSKCGVNDVQDRIIDGYTYPLTEYPTVVSKCRFVVTVNTFVYHLSIQLEKPCVVISVNEFESVKLDAPKQIIVFNKELQQAYESHTLDSYKPIPSISLQDIDCKRITDAIISLTYNQ